MSSRKLFTIKSQVNKSLSGHTNDYTPLHSIFEYLPRKHLNLAIFPHKSGQSSLIWKDIHKYEYTEAHRNHEVTWIYDVAWTHDVIVVWLTSSMTMYVDWRIYGMRWCYIESRLLMRQRSRSLAIQWGMIVWRSESPPTDCVPTKDGIHCASRKKRRKKNKDCYPPIDLLFVFGRDYLFGRGTLPPKLYMHFSMN